MQQKQCTYVLWFNSALGKSNKNVMTIILYICMLSQNLLKTSLNYLHFEYVVYNENKTVRIDPNIRRSVH